MIVNKKAKRDFVIKSRLHVLRAEKRITQEELANEIGITRATIIAIEKPKAIITNNARIFLLEMFLIALLIIPIIIQSIILNHFGNQKETWRGIQ